MGPRRSTDRTDTRRSGSGKGSGRALFDQQDVAELATRAESGLIARQPLGHEGVDPLVEVLPDLVADVFLQRSAGQPPSYPVHGFTSPRTSLMPFSMRSKLDISRSSRVRPAGVML
jgi:hypothetical protein